MRSLPLLLALLIGITALTLGLVAWLQDPKVVAVDPAHGPGASVPKYATDSGNAAGDLSPGNGAPGHVAAPAELPQGHIYAGVTSEPDDVNPFTSHSAVARRFILGLTHEGLIDTDPKTGALRGAVAESWQLAADGMSCTFTLREGVQFSDGSPVTMADVLFGWELAAAGHLTLGFVADAFDRVAEAVAVDERTLRVSFHERHYAAVRAVGEPWLVVQKRFFLDRIRAMCARLEQPMPEVGSAAFATLFAQIRNVCGPGTGPFQLPSDADGPTTWRRRQELLLVRNPHHWRREAMPGTWNLDGMRLLFLQGAAISNALFAGDLDWAPVRSVDQMLRDRPELREHYRKLSYDYETLGVMGIVWNCDKAAVADVRVRRALARLLDPAAVAVGHPDRAVPAVALAKPGSSAYPTDVDAFAFDVPKARQLLREAGFDAATGKPLRLTLLATPDDGGPMDLGLDLLLSAAQEAGVEITVKSLPFPAYVAEKSKREWDGVLVHQSFRPWGDPYDFVHSAGLDNDGHWRNDEADRLAAAARAELDAEKRTEYWRQLHAVVYREQPIAFLVHPRSCILFNKHIQDAVPGPRGLWPERWWVPAEYQRK